MKINTAQPRIIEGGWFVELPCPAEAVLAQRFERLGETERLAADAQAWLFQMDRPKLQSALERLFGTPGTAALAAALEAEDALRWGEMDHALQALRVLVKLPVQGQGAVRAWARLREVEALERAGLLAEAEAKMRVAGLLEAEGSVGPEWTGLLETQRAVIAARLAFRQGHLDQALATLEAAPPPSDQPSPVLGAWLRSLAIYTSLAGRLDRALGQHQQALDCFRALGDRYHLVKQYTSLAQTFLETGELDHAELYADKAAETLGGLRHPQLQALAKSRRGMIAMLQGDLERAHRLFAEDLALSEAAGLRPGAHYARRNLGKVLVRLGQPAEGAAHLAASAQGFRDYGDPINAHLSRAEEIAARLPLQAPEALGPLHDELESMAAFFAERGRTALAAQVDGVRARLLARRGALPLARDLTDAVVRGLRQHRRSDRVVEFLAALAEDYPETARDEAAALLRRAYREAERAGLRGAAARVLRALDARSELAALDLARAPRVPAGLGSEALAPDRAAEGFFEQSRCPAFRSLLQEARRVAASDITVLILGETGTGKDWLARYVHAHSPRREAVYRAYNCGAVSESLLEAELFGYERGAFTGASESRVGLFEAASGGTVLLDEVGELSPRAQAALLRVLDQRVVQPVGSPQPRPVDVRILAATNRDLAAEVAAGRFRADLYYRLAAYPLEVPPLRERREDFPALVEHLLSQMGDAQKKEIRGLDEGALEALLGYPWPGNLRELKNVLQAAVLRAVGRGRVLRRKHLPRHVVEPSLGATTAPFPTLEEMEQRHIRAALRRARGNQSRAAALLGIHRNTLANKMRRYGIES